MTNASEDDVKSFMLDRYERSPLEFRGSLMCEFDDHPAAVEPSAEARYRIRVYREFQRDYVLEVAVLSGTSVLFQTADFAENVQEIDDLLCLLHHDAMQGLEKVRIAETEDRKALSKRLENQLTLMSVQLLKRLDEVVAG